MTKDAEGLVPCPTPWCTNSDPYIFSRGRDIVGVTCRTCDVSTGYHHGGAGAIAEWNTRAPPPTTDLLHQVKARLSNHPNPAVQHKIYDTVDYLLMQAVAMNGGAALPAMASGFLDEIMNRTPNGEWIAVQYHPNGDWSVAEKPRRWGDADGLADACILAANEAGPTLHLEQHDAIRQALNASVDPLAMSSKAGDDVVRLRNALEPFALLADGGVNMNDPLSKWFTVGQLQEAEAALTAVVEG